MGKHMYFCEQFPRISFNSGKKRFVFMNHLCLVDDEDREKIEASNHFGTTFVYAGEETEKKASKNNKEVIQEPDNSQTKEEDEVTPFNLSDMPYKEFRKFFKSRMGYDFVNKKLKRAKAETLLLDKEL